jgi:hypothetical protein
LEKLERTFVFHRGAAPALEVSDEVKYTQPESFETALITWGNIKILSPNSLEITDGNGAVRVTVDAQGHSFKFHQETINEDVDTKRKPIRLGIILDDKISGGIVALNIVPIQKLF